MFSISKKIFFLLVISSLLQNNMFGMIYFKNAPSCYIQYSDQKVIELNVGGNTEDFTICAGFKSNNDYECLGYLQLHAINNASSPKFIVRDCKFSQFYKSMVWEELIIFLYLITFFYFYSDQNPVLCFQNSQFNHALLSCISKLNLGVIRLDSITHMYTLELPQKFSPQNQIQFFVQLLESLKQKKSDKSCNLGELNKCFALLSSQAKCLTLFMSQVLNHLAELHATKPTYFNENTLKKYESEIDTEVKAIESEIIARLF